MYILLNVPRSSSASSLFASHGLATFGAVIRKFILSLNTCIHKTATSNSLLLAFLNSDICIWLRGTVVEHRSLAGELSLSCARPAADG